MEIKLETIVNFIEPNDVFVQPWEGSFNNKKTVSLDRLTVKRVVNLPEDKKVLLEVKELILPITLWEGDSYIDNWTDSDVDNRVKELYKIS